MRTIQINLPDNLVVKEYDVKMLVASKLYEQGQLTAGQAAEVAGLSKRTFIELLGSYGVSIFSNSISDLYSDIKHA